MLSQAGLTESKREDLVAKLQAALDKLDPELLLLPAYEREGPNSTRPNVRPPRRQSQSQQQQR